MQSIRIKIREISSITINQKRSFINDLFRSKAKIKINNAANRNQINLTLSDIISIYRPTITNHNNIPFQTPIVLINQPIWKNLSKDHSINKQFTSVNIIHHTKLHNNLQKITQPDLTVHYLNLLKCVICILTLFSFFLFEEIH